MHPARHARQVLADLNAGHGGGNRPKLASDFYGSIGLQIDHILSGGTAEQIQDDNIFSPAPAVGDFFRLQKLRQPEAAQDSQGACL